jgi:arylsulfatase A-like enzyme
MASSLRPIACAAVGAVGVLVAAASLPVSAQTGQGTRPNIVLIMADDLGFSDLSSYGSEIQTPNIDRLASQGLRFTQFYNAARCVPTRASLLTGLYPHQAGIGHMVGKSPNGLYDGDLGRDAITVAEALKSAGYSTYMAGKWHVTPWNAAAPGAVTNGPTDRGFDRFYGTIESIRNYYNPPSLMEDGRPLPATEGDYHYTDAITERAVRYINTHDRSGRPYFLYVAYSAPHWPLHAREADIARHRGRFRPGWDVLRRARHQRLADLGLIDKSWPLPPRDARVLPWDSIRDDYRNWFDERMAVYAAMIDQMDRGIGEILRAVEGRGEQGRTLVLFLSDNGGCAEEIGSEGRAAGFSRRTRDGRPVRLGNDPAIAPGAEDTFASYGMEWAWLSNAPFRRFKSFVHEGGIATPLVVSWPGTVKPGVTHDQGHVIDLLPTFLDAAGATYPARFGGREIVPVEGRSLLPVLAGGTRPEAIFGWEHEGNRALRQGDWKLVSAFSGAWELYNMRLDRLETRDLSRQMPERVAAMEALYDRWAGRAGVKPWTGEQTPIGWPDAARRYGK